MKIPKITALGLAALTLLGIIVFPSQLWAEGNGTEDLAKAAQNPVADLISLPFQNNTNFNFGPENKTQNIFNIQQVWPLSLTVEWNLIKRTIVPLINRIELFPGDDRENGWGDGTCPAAADGHERQAGNRQWGNVPSTVALNADDPWLYGALASV